MSVIKPNKNFYNKGTDYIFNYRAYISSSTLTKNNINISFQIKKLMLYMNDSLKI